MKNRYWHIEKQEILKSTIDLATRRTEPFLQRMIAAECSLQDLCNAIYIQGVNDTLDNVVNQKEEK
jgi:hypothetical protein